MKEQCRNCSSAEDRGAAGVKCKILLAEPLISTDVTWNMCRCPFNQFSNKDNNYET